MCDACSIINEGVTPSSNVFGNIPVKLVISGCVLDRSEENTTGNKSVYGRGIVELISSTNEGITLKSFRFI